MVVSTGATVQLAVVLPAQVPPVQLYEVGVLVQLAVSVDEPARDTVLGAAARVQIGAPAGTPTPLTGSTCGLPAALSVNTIELVVVPATVGLKVTFTVQLAPAARLAPQLWVRPNTLLLLTMLVMFKTALPVLVRVAVLAALVVPIFCAANDNEQGLHVAIGAVGVSAKLAVTALAAPMLSTQLPVPVQSPAQPVNELPAVAAAISVTELPLAKLPVQVAPQLMPAGLLVTVPAPVPFLFTVTRYVGVVVNVAVTVTAAAGMVKVQGLALAQPAKPVQPPNAAPASAVAVSVTVLPLSTLAVQVAPQVMPEPATAPVPAPALLTVSVKLLGVGGVDTSDVRLPAAS